MGREVYTKEIPGPISRARRFLKKQNSAGSAIARLGEEAIVRAWDKPAIRNLVSPMVPRREPAKWLFLVGCYNSGTTLLQSILGAHPQIAGLPREGVRFTSALSNLELNDHHMFWDRNWKEHAHPRPAETPQAIERIKRDWSVFWKSGADIFFDKSVSNTARIEWLEANFANAHFIGLHRNGYCIAEGLHRRSRPPKWLQEETGKPYYPLDMAGQQWVTANRAMLDGLKRIDRKLMVSFEDVVTDPAGQIERVFEFLGVDGGPIVFKDEELNVGGKLFAVHDPNPASLNRLGPEGIEKLRPVIEPMMKELGYDEQA